MKGWVSWTLSLMLCAATLVATVGACCACVMAGQARAHLDESVAKLQETLRQNPNYVDAGGSHCDEACMRREVEHIAMHEQMGDFRHTYRTLKVYDGNANDLSALLTAGAYELDGQMLQVVFRCHRWLRIGPITISFGITLPGNHDVAICYGDDVPDGCLFFDRE